jgi:Amt family ammonium transporter
MHKWRCGPPAPLALSLYLTGFIAGLIGLTEPALAAPPDKGDTGFLMISAVLVLLMTIPGLALFYAGLVRTKNVLSVLVHVFATVCLVCVLWIAYGYSLAFTSGGEHSRWFGGFSRLFLSGVTPASEAATFSHGVTVPEYAYIFFQMTFAAITPALIVGSFAERMKFSAVMTFMALWLTFVYCPIAHMVWYWPGPDAIATAAAAVASATGEAKQAAQLELDRIIADAGWIYQMGAIDFAGGTVVHVNAGIAGLVGALVLRPRAGYGREPMPPHSLTLSVVGACLLWVGWFGFNCGSNLEANGTAALAMGNTFAATAAAALGWMIVESIAGRRPSILGATTGAIAGLVAVTPASGFAAPAGALALGFVTSCICYLFCTAIKGALGYDDSLDVFGVHCIAGIVGALGTGLLVNPGLGGTGVADYVSSPGQVVVGYDMATQMAAQAKAVALTLLWSGLGSLIIYKLIDWTIGLRVSLYDEREGLDVMSHGERGYNYF